MRFQASIAQSARSFRHISARSSNREKHGEIDATANLSTRLVLLFFGFSKTFAQGFAAEATLNHLQLTVETQLLKRTLYFGYEN